MNYLKAWCENILVIVMITTIIEMLLPEGKMQKYVKVVISIYLIFSILQNRNVNEIYIHI